MAWGVGGWLLLPFLLKIGPADGDRLRQRVVAELKTTFASHYTQVVSLQEALQLSNIADLQQARHRREISDQSEQGRLNLSRATTMARGRVSNTGQMTAGIGRRRFISALGGAAATWPLAARGQQARRAAQVGFLYPGVAAVSVTRITALREGLCAVGYGNARPGGIPRAGVRGRPDQNWRR